MTTEKKDPVTAKRTRPYPILTKVIKAETIPPIEGQILRVTTLGFQVEMAQIGFSVGDFFTVEFTLPFSHHTIVEKVRVVRTMDRFKDEKATIKGYLVEMHFLHLSSLNARFIGDFTSSINQKPA